MSCGLNILREGGLARGPPREPPLNLQNIARPRPPQQGGRGEGRAQVLALPPLAYGLDFGSRYVKLVYSLEPGGLGAAEVGQHRLLP